MSPDRGAASDELSTLRQLVGDIRYAAGRLRGPMFLSHAQPAPPPAQPPVAAEATSAVSVLGGRLVFRDANAQAKEFIGCYHSIRLTSEQEAIKKAALEPMPAVCCRNSSAYTCCPRRAT